MTSPTFALVGWEGSQDDHQVLTFIYDHTRKRRPNWVLDDDSLVGAVFSLNGDDRKDFLTDQTRFNVVCLMRVYDPDNEPIDADHFRVSEIHSPDQWRTRLEASRADFIFVWGGEDDASVGLEFLGSIPGYAIVPFSCPFPVALYEQQ